MTPGAGSTVSRNTPESLSTVTSAFSPLEIVDSFKANRSRSSPVVSA